MYNSSASAQGQVSLAKSDLAMNALHRKVQDAELVKPEQLQEYLNTTCQLPLPKYQDGGIFHSYITQQDHASPFESKYGPSQAPIIDHGSSLSPQYKREGIHSRQNQSLMNKTLEGGKSSCIENCSLAQADSPTKESKSRPSTQLETLGKVHLTKQMKKERELFLGIGPGAKASKRIRAGKESSQGGFTASGNGSLQLAWNTTGFLPTSISSAGQKNSVKDFEYLKFLNDTILKDDVLDKFMQKAGEIEQAAGPKGSSCSPSKKVQMTPMERVRSEFKRNPHKLHTCLRFDSFFQTNQTRKNRLKRVEKDKVDVESGTQDVEATLKSSKCGHCDRDQKSSARHKSCAPCFQPRNQKLKTGPSRKTNKKSEPRQESSVLRDLGQSQKDQPAQPRSILIEQKHLKNAERLKVQTKLSHLGSSNNSTQKELVQTQESNRTYSKKPGTSGGTTRRKIANASECYLDLDDQKQQLINELKRTSVDMPHDSRAIMVQTDKQFAKRNSAQISLISRKAKATQPMTQYQEQQPKNDVDPYRQAFSRASKAASSAVSPRESSTRGLSQKRQTKLITNITGQVTDKLKLTTRLNAAVDDLIQMGQRYKEKSKQIANQIPPSNQMTSLNPSQASIHDRSFSQSKVSSVPDVLSSMKQQPDLKDSVKSHLHDRIQSINKHLEGSLLSIDELEKVSNDQATPRQVPLSSHLQAKNRYKNNRFAKEEPFISERSIERHTSRSKRNGATASVFVSFDVKNEREKQKQVLGQQKVDLQNPQRSSLLEPICMSRSKNLNSSFDSNAKTRLKGKGSPWMHQRSSKWAKQGGLMTHDDTNANQEKSQDSLPSLHGIQGSNQSPVNTQLENRSRLKSNTSQDSSLERAKQIRNQVQEDAVESGRRSKQPKDDMKRIYRNRMHMVGDDKTASRHQLSKEKLKEIRFQQSNKAIQSALAKEKKKITDLSKLKPVLNTSSRGSLSREHTIRNEVSIDGLTAKHQGLLLEPMSGDQIPDKSALNESPGRASRQTCSNLQTKPPHRLVEKFEMSQWREGASQPSKRYPISDFIDNAKKWLNAEDNSPKKQSNVTGTIEQRGREPNRKILTDLRQPVRPIDKPFNNASLLQKDEAIEMIQTGPREQFSNVLRQYLSSQAHTATSGAHSRASSSRCNILQERQQSVLVPASQFVKAQQKLLSKNNNQQRLEPTQSLLVYQNNGLIRQALRDPSVSSSKTSMARNGVIRARVTSKTSGPLRRDQFLSIARPVRQTSPPCSNENLVSTTEVFNQASKESGLTREQENSSGRPASRELSQTGVEKSDQQVRLPNEKPSMVPVFGEEQTRKISRLRDTYAATKFSNQNVNGQQSAPPQQYPQDSVKASSQQAVILKSRQGASCRTDNANKIRLNQAQATNSGSRHQSSRRTGSTKAAQRDPQSSAQMTSLKSKLATIQKKSELSGLVRQRLAQYSSQVESFEPTRVPATTGTSYVLVQGHQQHHSSTCNYEGLTIPTKQFSIGRTKSVPKAVALLPQPKPSGKNSILMSGSVGLRVDQQVPQRNKASRNQPHGRTEQSMATMKEIADKEHQLLGINDRIVSTLDGNDSQKRPTDKREQSRKKRRNIIVNKERQDTTAPETGQEKPMPNQCEGIGEQEAEDRPKLRRPSFLDSALSMQIMQQARAMGTSDTLSSRVISPSNERAIQSLQKTIEQNNRIVNQTTIIGGGQQDQESATQSRVWRARAKTQVSNVDTTQLSIEERLQQSSIMAMQLDGIGPSTTTEDPQLPVVHFKSIFNRQQPAGMGSN